MRRTIIRGGTIASADGCFDADVVCADGRIVEIGTGPIAGDDDIELAADGKFVLPGGIDVHTHFSEPFMGTVTADDFTTGGEGAICGGVTSHIDFAFQYRGQSLEDAITYWHALADGKAVIDYGLHLAITELTDEVRREIPEMVAAGYSSFKVFMTYPALVVEDHDLLEILQLVSEAEGRVSVHAENFAISAALIDQFVREGKLEPRWHAPARPSESEWEATVRAMALARVAEAPLYVVHMSAAASVEEVAEARTLGYPVIGETCIHYLVFTHDVYNQDGFEPAARYICSPPIRSREHQDALWTALRTGILQVVGSDHAPFTLADRKRLGGDNFSTIPNGVAGIEQIRPFLWTEGVKKDRLSVERFVALTATNPAKAFGLWPRKGGVIVGGDADLVIWDPDKRITHSMETTHSACDYCLYDGLESKGGATTTISRGELVWHDGALNAPPGRGQFLKRTTVAHV
jgi:dihydropyrimidinase